MRRVQRTITYNDRYELIAAHNVIFSFDASFDNLSQVFGRIVSWRP